MENLGQSGSDSKLGIVDQIRMAELDRFVTSFQPFSAKFVGSYWAVGFDQEATTPMFAAFGS